MIMTIVRDIWDWILRIKEKKRIEKLNTPIIEVHMDSVFDEEGNLHKDGVLVNILKDMSKKMKVRPKHIHQLIAHRKLMFETGRNKKTSPYQLSEDYSRRYLKQFLKVYKSIKKRGYKLERYGHIAGKMHKAKCTLKTGYRRAAVLFFLGAEKIKVKLVK